MEAILIQNFPIIYPFMQNPESTADTVYEEIYFAEAEKLNVAEPEILQPAKKTLKAYYMFLFSAPLIGTLSQQSVYCIALIVLVSFSLHDKLWRFLLAALPAVLSLGIIILAPAIQWEPRYAFPIIYSMPLLTAYYSYLIRNKEFSKGR